MENIPSGASLLLSWLYEGIVMTEHYRGLLTSRVAFLVYGVLLAGLLILGIRFVSYSELSTHYHANMAVYINGQRERFELPQYYEEVAICGLHDNMTPKMRAHLHNQENSVVHVHDDGVTWGQFFENLGWYVGPDFIRSPAGLYTENESSKLHIMLNGQDLTGLSTITNELVGNKDRLLVSYGDVPESELASQYKTVPADAGEYNVKPDPATCAGPGNPGVNERLRNLF